MYSQGGRIKHFFLKILYGILMLSFLLWPLTPAKAGEVWEMVGGFGLGDPDNIVIATMETWNNAIYAGIKNETDGARIYRSTDGNTWTQVFSHAATLNTVISFEPFGNRLYASVIDDDDVPAQSAEIWSTADGITWTQSGADGLGNANNRRFYNLAVFNNQLYVGSFNTVTGAELFTTADGITWDKIVGVGEPITGGFDDATNFAIWGLYSFGGWLWAGTANIGGAQVWRFDGITWELYMDYADYLWLHDSTAVNHFFEYNGLLYWFGIDAALGANIAERRSEVFHVFYIGGLGDVKNIWFSLNTVVSGGLYFGTRNPTTGGELWYVNNITDGNSFTQIGLDGFGNVDNFAIYALTFKDYLYIGLSTVNGLKGAEIWRRVYTADFVITTKSLKNGQQGSAYSSPLTATDGTQPLTWSIASGNLPKGLSLNSATGEISGTPQESGEFRFIIEVQDSGKKSQKARHIYTLKIVAGASDNILDNITILPQTGADLL